MWGKKVKAAKRGEEVTLVAKAALPTRFGLFTIAGFYDHREGKEHTAVIRGEVAGTVECLVRIHSECHTGDVLGSLRCDCRDQLEEALRIIGRLPFGLLIYLRQEGRGIGLLNKIKAYQLQDAGFDTVDANEYLGFPSDARDYRVASRIIEFLQIRSVVLLTNNPSKIEGLRAEGVVVERRMPIIAPRNRFNDDYLSTKQRRMGHLL